MTPLARRERQVLAVYVEQESITNVAHELGLSRQHVKNTLSSVYRKLDVTNYLGALKAMGWLEVTELTRRDWNQVMADYQTLSAHHFDAKYPGWHNDEQFMERLGEELGHAAETAA